MRHKWAHRIGRLAPIQETSVCAHTFDYKQDFLEVISETDPTVSFFKKEKRKKKSTREGKG